MKNVIVLMGMLALIGCSVETSEAEPQPTACESFCSALSGASCENSDPDCISACEASYTGSCDAELSEYYRCVADSEEPHCGDNGFSQMTNSGACDYAKQAFADCGS